FFSSRRRHTRSYGDWSSDVCSSDLEQTEPPKFRGPRPPQQFVCTARWRSPIACRSRAVSERRLISQSSRADHFGKRNEKARPSRSEERRVGKECRYRWSPRHYKKKT